MNRLKQCLQCAQHIDSDYFLHCIACNKYIHTKCLKRPGTPGDLLGDVFFQFNCSYCTADGKEIFTRDRLPWAMLVVLALHNLSIQSKGLSHHGYFHWRTHIAYFIEKNWSYLMGSAVRRKKKWTGTISGTLSHNTPGMFNSGSVLFKENGWWKLTYNQSPKRYMDLYKKLRTEKRRIKNTQISKRLSPLPSQPQHKKPRLNKPEIFSRALPYMGCVPRHLKSKASTNSAQENLADFLSSNMSNIDLLSDLSNMSPCSGTELIPSLNSSSSIIDWPDNFLDLSYNDESYDTNFQPRIVQITNFQETDGEPEFSVEVATNIKTESESDDDYTQFECEKSLFTIVSKRRPPWEEEEVVEDYTIPADYTYDDKYIEVMSEYEENELLKQMKSVIDAEERENNPIPQWVRRFYRKLCLRELKRGFSKPIFDLDNLKHNINRDKSPSQILDRYHQLICTSNSRMGKSQFTSFHVTLVGSAEYDLFVSPHTGRVLHPFIFRNTKCIPQWVQLMCDIQYAVNGVVPKRASIDYCYVRPHHIAAVNALLQKQFWPGIDMSECLSYPDFSIVAMYKKLVVGCGFLVPDVGHNIAYVSFMAVRLGWQRAGIASFMLYHLTQTCMGKDITLHVSATNPAICLYQKFGFKIEEVILDFYEKYLPIVSIHSQHALFLRMKR